MWLSFDLRLSVQAYKTHVFIHYPLNPDVTAVYVLSEFVSCLSSKPVSWLPVLRHHSLVTVLVRMMDEHLRLRSDVEFIEATLSSFLALSRTKPVRKQLNARGIFAFQSLLSLSLFFLSLSQGAEVLVVNGISQSLSISLSDALLSMLSPPEEAQERQVHHQWLGLWQLSLKLMSSLLDSLDHQFISDALHFTGVNQERLFKVYIAHTITFHKVWV